MHACEAHRITAWKSSRRTQAFVGSAPSRTTRVVHVRLSVYHSLQAADDRDTSGSLLPAGLHVDELKSSRKAFSETQLVTRSASRAQSCWAVCCMHFLPHPTNLLPSHTSDIAPNH